MISSLLHIIFVILVKVIWLGLFISAILWFCIFGWAIFTGKKTNSGDIPGLPWL